MSAKPVSPSKIVIIAAGLIGASVAYWVTSRGLQWQFGGNSVESQIQRLVDEANKKLPMQVDEMTRWERVEAGPGKSFSYIYTLSRDVTEEEKKLARENTTRKSLASPEMKQIFDAGVTVWYKYYAPSGKLVLEFPVKR